MHQFLALQKLTLDLYPQKSDFFSRHNMVITEETEKKMQPEKMDNLAIGEALRDLIIIARNNDRLTCGVASSAKLLEMNSDVVMMCILPVDPNQPVTVAIQQTLIEAFCWEREICLMKVDSTEKLASLVRADDSNGNEQDYKDYCCVLVQCPSESNTSQPDKMIAKYYNLYMNGSSNRPIIELPG